LGFERSLQLFLRQPAFADHGFANQSLPGARFFYCFVNLALGQESGFNKNFTDGEFGYVTTHYSHGTSSSGVQAGAVMILGTKPSDALDTERTFMVATDA
jgi:hypothetical protein